MTGGLPAGWDRRALSGLVLPVQITRPDKRPDDEFWYIDISSIDRGTKRIVQPQRLLGASAPSRARQIVRAGDVLVSTVRPNLRTIAAVPPELDGEIASTGFCVVRPGPDILSEFLFYAILEESFQERVQAKARGISYPAVRAADILVEPINVPPLNEQEAVVRRLRAALAEIEASRRELSAARGDVELFEATVRREACESDAMTTLADVATVQSGIAKGRAKQGALEELPYVRTANVQAGRLDLAEMKTLEVTADQIARHSLRAGDVLVLEGGDADKVGRGWIWAGEVEPCLHQNHVFAVRVDSTKLDARFLAHYINAPQARAYFGACAKQTTNLASINKGQLKDLPVPDLPIAEQQRRAARLDALLSEGEALADALGQAAEGAVELERALISYAMGGHLSKAVENPTAREIRHEARAAIY